MQTRSRLTCCCEPVSVTSPQPSGFDENVRCFRSYPAVYIMTVRHLPVLSIRTARTHSCLTDIANRNRALDGLQFASRPIRCDGLCQRPVLVVWSSECRLVLYHPSNTAPRRPSQSSLKEVVKSPARGRTLYCTNLIYNSSAGNNTSQGPIRSSTT